MRPTLNRSPRCLTLLLALSAGLALVTAAPAASESIDLAQAGSWMFRTDANDEGLAKSWQQPSLKDADFWRPITVPGAWETQEKNPVTKPNPKAPAQGPGDGYNGCAWYRCTFTVPAGWKTGRMFLDIGAIDDLGSAYVNGQPVQSVGSEDTVGGPRRYAVDAGLLKPGKQNLIAIRVLDTGGLGGITDEPVKLVREEEPAVTEGAPTEAPPSGAADRFTETDEDQVEIGSDIEVGRETKIEGDVISVGGSVKILGWVTGDAVAVGGSVIIGREGRVDGGVASVGGAITKEKGAQLGGEEVYVGGHAGEILRKVIADTLGAPETPPPPGAPPYRGWLRSLLLGIAIFASLLAALVLPRRLNLMAEALPLHPGRVAVTGAVGLMLTPGVVLAVVIVGAIVGGVLCATVVGIIPGLAVLLALPALLVGLVAVVALGSAAVWFSLGRAMLDKLGRTHAHPLVAALLGLLVVALVASIPVVGALVTVTVLILGYGVAIITGLGRHEDWLSRRRERRRGHRPAPSEPVEPTPPSPEPVSEPPTPGQAVVAAPAEDVPTEPQPEPPLSPPVGGPPADAGQGI